MGLSLILAGMYICMHACMCVCVCKIPIGVFVYMCALVSRQVDVASCVPRGLQTQSEPLLWPGLCKFFPPWECLVSPVSCETFMSVATHLLLLSPLLSFSGEGYWVSFSVVSEGWPGTPVYLLWLYPRVLLCGCIPEGLYVEPSF